MCWVLGVDAALDCVTPQAGLPHPTGHRYPGVHADLQFYQVQPVDQFGNGVLNLYAGVHLHEVELTVGIHQKFHCAGPHITHVLRCQHGCLAQLLAHLIIDNR